MIKFFDRKLQVSVMQEFIRRIQNARQVNHIIMDRIRPIIDEEPLWSRSDQSFSIRLAKAEDVPLFIELENDAYKGFHAWTQQDFEHDWFRNPYCVYILVEDTTNKEVVAMISGRFLAKGAHISHLLVREKYQNQRLGSKLLDLWIRLAEIEEVPIITLEVRESNTIAQNLYYGQDFKKHGIKENYYSDNKETAFLLKREMPNA